MNKKYQIHKTVRIEFDTMFADIDEKIAPLVFQLWKLGIKTNRSCQENEPGVIWINFPGLRNAKKFISKIPNIDYHWQYNGEMGDILFDKMGNYLLDVNGNILYSPITHNYGVRFRKEHLAKVEKAFGIKIKK